MPISYLFQRGNSFYLPGIIRCLTQSLNKNIFEFKLNGSKEDALQQIINKQYAQKYQHSSKSVVLLGVEFDRQQRNIGELIRQ